MKTHNLISSPANIFFPDDSIFEKCKGELENSKNTRIVHYRLDSKRLTKHKKPWCYLSEYLYDCRIRGVYTFWKYSSGIDRDREYLYIGTILGKNDIIGRCRAFIQVCLRNNNPHFKHSAAKKMIEEYDPSTVKSMIDNKKIHMSFISENSIESILTSGDKQAWMIKSQKIEELLIQHLRPKYNSNRKYLRRRGTGKTPTTTTLQPFFII